MSVWHIFSCKKPIMDSTTSFDVKKTVKVCGVSQLLRDQIEKEFQTKGNSTGYNADVNKLYVCPNGKDHVLVEFAKDIPVHPTAIRNTLKIVGTELRVEEWNSVETASNDDFKSESVSKIWQADEEAPIAEAFINTNEGETCAKGKDSGTEAEKKVFGKEARQNKFDKRRRGLHSDQKPTPEPPFGETKVKLNKDFVKKVEDDDEFDKILNEEDVKLSKGKLIGTWNGIYAAGQKLLSFISRLYQTENNYDQSEVPPRATDQSGRSNDPDESFSVSSLFLRFIIAYHYEEYQKLENVSQEISFEVSESKTDRKMNFFARQDVNGDTFSKTVDQFISFYQYQNQKMHQEVILMFPKKKNDVILDARTKFSVVIDSARESDKITIYGERDDVEEALKFLKSKVGDLTTSTPGSSSEFKGATGGRSSKGATGSSSSKGAAAGRSPNPKSTTGGKVFIEKLSCVLFQYVKVFVYQGDITKETADVIVNPANEELKHSAGAAAAIVKAGGKSIQDESDEIMKKRRYSLKPGEVVATKAGNLPCSFIVHAVGPRWANYRHYEKDTAKKLLLSAVLNCLTHASHYGATSISIPAISSGIFGVPVPICAEILFSAATSFAKNAPNSNPLKEIHFVNIDVPTSQVFAQEMKKRFGASIHRENAELFRSNVGGGSERVDQYAENQFNAWKENPMVTTKTTALVDLTTSKVTFEGSRDFLSGSDNNKGNQGNKSSLNPKAPAFSTSESHSSPTPTSYSNALTGKPNNQKDKKTGLDTNSSGDDKCAVCLCDFTDKKTLPKCGHSFCAACIDEAFKHQKKCPVCSQVYGPLIGNQPDGKMFVAQSSVKLPGYESCGGSIRITYRFENGVQGPNHPNPGQRYSGTARYGYLPNNSEGQKVLKLLRKAFDQKLIFTIGRSSTTGANNVITWNDIHHKTNIAGGPTNFGYPDAKYLKRVQEELAAKGITE